MKKSRLFIVLSLALVFVAGAVAGVFADRLWFSKRPGARPGGRGFAPTHERWAKDLGLTDDQQARIKEIFKKNDERMKPLRAEYDKIRKEFDVRVGGVREELRKEIDAVLTPEQRQKQAEMIKQARER